MVSMVPMLHKPARLLAKSLVFAFVLPPQVSAQSRPFSSMPLLDDMTCAETGFETPQTGRGRIKEEKPKTKEELLQEEEDIKLLRAWLPREIRQFKFFINRKPVLIRVSQYGALMYRGDGIYPIWDFENTIGDARLKGSMLELIFTNGLRETVDLKKMIEQVDSQTPGAKAPGLQR